MEKHVSKINAKLSKCLAILYTINSLTEKESLRALYCSLFLPYIDYFCEVWGTTYKCHVVFLVVCRSKLVIFTYYEIEL